MIEVVNRVREYPERDEPYRTLIVRSHWNRDEFVILDFGDEKPWRVTGRDLITAIENAMRSAR